MARWGLVRFKLDAAGPKVWLEEKGRAYLAVLALREANAHERFGSRFGASETGRTTCEKPNLQGISRGR